jgi:cytochrome c-type biogenesis protein CcmF
MWPPVLACSLYRINNNYARTVIAFSVSLIYYFYGAEYGFISAASILLCSNIFYIIRSISRYGFVNQHNSYTGHLGFSLLVITICINNLLSYEVEFLGKRGDAILDKQGNIISLADIRYVATSNYYRQIAEIDYNKQYRLSPEYRFYPVEKMTIAEPFIYSFIFYDIYAVLNNVKEDVVHATIYYKPAMFFLWLAGAIMLISPIKF